MKKFLAILGVLIFTWGGLWLALIAEFNDAHPLAQGGQSILAAISFCVALLFAGYGNSITWKGQKKK